MILSMNTLQASSRFHLGINCVRVNIYLGNAEELRIALISDRIVDDLFPAVYMVVNQLVVN